MRILALDTALEACAAAVLDTERRDLVASETRPMTRGHAEALMPMVARVMDAARLEFSEIDRIAVTIGPGSFTGVRVGIAAARGLALAAGKPAIGLTTLAAFTAPHVAGGFAGTVVPVIDARHGQVYMQVFGPGGRAVVPPRLAAIGEAVEAARSRAPALIAGSAADLVASQWPPGEPPPKIVAASAPDIAWVARLGAAAQEDRALPKPLYLRPPDARPQDAARISHR
ncbi:MAG TPA: tRNA (adenosine(37)-N6)-threonylcarbamoyltransferase complex dimerization subunit type 1 TsaB [Xanthobacteraceae bacterium]|nr:tRNA (adenosine(37)-N6)-threonylcarbamoyltransferase complex dimerization subunit type 1 TsaB [Xanthobacteraceae bacterium]